MVRRKHALILLGLLLSCAAFLSVLMPARAVDAQETCAAQCLQAFAACYKRTQNRVQCEQVRETCIKQCKRPH